jgi:hypothetical protein
MDLAQLCWISTAAYGLHILEELILDWRNWARSIMHLPVDWNIFYAANALVIGNCGRRTRAGESDACPRFSSIDADQRNLLPCRRIPADARPLFFPIGIQCFRVALRSGAISTLNVIESFLLGAAIMMTPILFLKLRNKPYFNQDR